MDKEPIYDDGYEAFVESDLYDPEKLIQAGDTSPDTPKKRRTNWMNRNMPFMMGALALALVLLVVVSTLFIQGGPDYIVGLVTSYTMPEPGRRQLEELLTAYADDRNGDGRVSVQLNAYAFVPNTTDQGQREEALLDLEATLVCNECMIFLHDQAALGEIASQVDGLFQYNDGTPMPAGAADFENASLDWEDCRALSGFEPDPDRLNMWDPQAYLELCQSLRVSVRAVNGEIAQSEEFREYQGSSAAFVQRLQSGERP